MGRKIKVAKPDQLYKRGSKKHKEASREERNKLQNARRRGTAKRLLGEVKDPATKDYDAKVDGKAVAYAVLYSRVPKDTHAWVAELCVAKSATVGDVVTQLVKCAKEGVVFFMPERFSVAERRFYEQEIRKERRLAKLRESREKLREKMLRDRDALEHSLDPDALEV